MHSTKQNTKLDLEGPYILLESVQSSFQSCYSRIGIKIKWFYSLRGESGSQNIFQISYG